MTAIEKHELAIEILEAISYVNKRIDLLKDSINGFAGKFPLWREKYEHNVEISKMMIERLKLRYNNLIQTL